MDSNQNSKTDDRFIDLTHKWETNCENIIGNYHNLYNPEVVYDPNSEYHFKMFFFGWAAADDNPGYPGSDAIFHARSKDMQRWEVYSGGQNWDITMTPELWVPVLTAGDQHFNDVHAGDPSVVFKEDTFYMVYSAVGFDFRDENNMKQQYIINNVMAAVSKDGISWEKTEGPILIWDKEYEIGWKAYYDVPDNFYGGYHRPSLLFDDNKWKIWFDYYKPGTFLSMGYAENTGDLMDSSSWKVLRAGDEPLLEDWPNPDVIKIGGKYYSFSDAPGYSSEMPGRRQITMAESDDGLEWKVLGHIRPDGDEGSHVPQAFYHEDAEGKWLYLFYSWQPYTKPYDFRYKAIRFMRMRMK